MTSRGRVAMSREHTYLRILAVNAAIQQHLAVILEAKAMEMRKAGEWTNRHVNAAQFADHDSQLKASLKVHEQLIEVIEGVTKVESGLAKNLKILLSSGSNEDGEESSSSSDSGSLFDLGG